MSETLPGQYRWIVVLTLWTFLAGPILVAPVMWLRMRLASPAASEAPVVKGPSLSPLTVPSPLVVPTKMHPAPDDFPPGVKRWFPSPLIP